MVPVVPLFSTEHSKGKILARSQELRKENKCNGLNLGWKILQSRRSSAVVAGMKKPNDHAEPTKVERYYFFIEIPTLHYFQRKIQKTTTILK